MKRLEVFLLPLDGMLVIDWEGLANFDSKMKDENMHLLPLSTPVSTILKSIGVVPGLLINIRHAQA